MRKMNHLMKMREEPSEKEKRIEELNQELYVLEEKTRQILEGLPEYERQIIESLIDATAEREMYTLQVAFQRGKALGEKIGKNRKNSLI